MNSLYRIVWRWQFYAGLIVLPVLAWLAVTGGVYLYKPEIETWVYRAWIVRPNAAPVLPPSRVIDSVARVAIARVKVMIPAATSET